MSEENNNEPNFWNRLRSTNVADVLQRNLVLILLAALLLVILLPYLFTHINLGISFDTTGQIGDTIGGITAPIIGLVSAILVYLSFQQQLEANRLIIAEQQKLEKSKQEDLIISNISVWINRIEDSIDSFLYGKEEPGHLSIVSFLKDLNGAGSRVRHAMTEKNPRNINMSVTQIKSRPFEHFRSSIKTSVTYELVHILKLMYTLLEYVEKRDITTEGYGLNIIYLNEVINKEFNALNEFINTYKPDYGQFFPPHIKSLEIITEINTKKEKLKSSINL